MEMRPGELVDKYTIARLCMERLNTDREGLDALKQGVDELRKDNPGLPWDILIDNLYRVNGFIWGFEEPIHLGRLDEEPTMAGILSIRVRKFNVVRVSMSKLIDALVEGGKK